MHKIIFFILIYLFFATNLTFALEIYTPPKGSSERKAILDALREELKRFPEKEPSGIGFEYKREEVGVAKVLIEEGKELILIVNYLKVKDNWAWIEVRWEKYGIDIDSLLFKDEGKWVVKGIVDPRLVACLNYKECIDVKAYIYKRFIEKFPQAPFEIFPKVDLDRKLILNLLGKIHPELNLIFVLSYFKVKNGWAWIETNPRTADGGAFEPLNALLYKEKGNWVVKHVQPCCGDWEVYLEQNNIKSMEGYYRHLMRMFPKVTRDLFPK